MVVYILSISACHGSGLQVTKQPGDGVIGGTVNGSGLLYIRATCVGGQTVLAQIISLVEAAQAYKAPIQVCVDGRVIGTALTWNCGTRSTTK